MSANILFLVLVSALSIVNAIPWDGPRATGIDQLGADWSPAPTAAFRSPLELFRRAGQYPLTVCGFIGGNLAIPATCSSGESCVWFNDLNAVGCCTTSGSSCTFPTACLDSGSPTRTPNANNTFTMTCATRGPNNPECYTNSYPDGWTQVGCGYRSWATTVLTDGAPDMAIVATTKGSNYIPAPDEPDGKSDGSSESPTTSSSPSPASSSSKPAPSPAPSSAPSSEPLSDPSSNPSPAPSPGSSGTTVGAASASTGAGSATSNFGSLASTNGGSASSATGTTGSSNQASSGPGAAAATAAANQDPNSSGPNVGAIAGGAAAGGAILAILAALLAWFIIRRRRRRASSTKAALNDEKKSGHHGPAELPTYAAPTYHPELEGRPSEASQRISELYGREVPYQAYRPPVAELPTTRD